MALSVCHDVHWAYIIYIVCYINAPAYIRLLVSLIEDQVISMPARSGSSAISGRIPNALYRWLEAKVKNGEYPNLNQALIAQLMKAKTLEEEHETRKNLLSLRAEIVRDVIEKLKEESGGQHEPK